MLPGLGSLMGLEPKGTQERLCEEGHLGKESNMSKSKEVWNNQDIRNNLSIKNLSWVVVGM